MLQRNGRDQVAALGDFSPGAWSQSCASGGWHPLAGLWMLFNSQCLCVTWALKKYSLCTSQLFWCWGKIPDVCNLMEKKGIWANGLRSFMRGGRPQGRSIIADGHLHGSRFICSIQEAESGKSQRAPQEECLLGRTPDSRALPEVCCAVLTASVSLRTVSLTFEIGGQVSRAVQPSLICITCWGEKRSTISAWLSGT